MAHGYLFYCPLIINTNHYAIAFSFQLSAFCSAQAGVIRGKIHMILSFRMTSFASREAIQTAEQTEAILMLLRSRSHATNPFISIMADVCEAFFCDFRVFCG